MTNTPILSDNPQGGVVVNSAHAWLLAARPKTLSGAAVPIIIAGALALSDTEGHVAWLPLVLCLLFAFIMQIDANFVNDYFDSRRGNDAHGVRLGPPRACAEGWVTMRAMRTAIVLTTAMACLVGLPLVAYGGWMMILVGIACVVFCFLYTVLFSYLGLGDLLVLAFFGLVPVCLTYFLALPADSQVISVDALLLSIASGLVIDTLLLLNNYRDLEVDRSEGKMTLAVRIGPRATLGMYLGVGLAALALVTMVLIVRLPFEEMTVRGVVAVCLPAAVYLPLHLTTLHTMKQLSGKALNRVLAMTSRNMFVFAVVTAVALLME